MSTTSKVVLGASCFVSFGIVLGVHYKQQMDKEKMHQGVVRDQAIQEMKRRQNVVLLDQQTVLTQMLRDQDKEMKGT
ncbi:protein PET117 homolog, mitochondrial [Thrips palmi]|uniref:Protein PET117 homolog, mitochondrial n=1 Tax=Thrips palmi TaxID=161013 RepID=A0A6P8Y364_THRPL|nr:protein PET117 homolog, mitochondrial [Thrips palmi]